MPKSTEEVDACHRNGTSLLQNGCTEVTTIDESRPHACDVAMPTVSNMNVNKSQVHIGSKFVSITQNVHNTEVVKGQFLGLDLVHSINARRIRCGVAVFVCWALVVTGALTLYLIQISLNTKQTRMDLDLHEDWYLRRADWQALPAYDVDFLNLPVKYAVIGHSATKKCVEKYECIASMRAIQHEHIDRGFGDIGPNFLIGGEGSIFEARGVNVMSAMIPGWNRKMISVMFLGDYTRDVPEHVQFDHLSVLLDTMVKQNVLTPDYILSSKCQIATVTVSPGPNIVHELHKFAHWDPTNSSTCLPR